MAPCLEEVAFPHKLQRVAFLGMRCFNEPARKSLYSAQTRRQERSALSRCSEPDYKDKTPTASSDLPPLSQCWSPVSEKAFRSARPGQRPAASDRFNTPHTPPLLKEPACESGIRRRFSVVFRPSDGGVHSAAVLSSANAVASVNTVHVCPRAEDETRTYWRVQTARSQNGRQSFHARTSYLQTAYSGSRPGRHLVLINLTRGYRSRSVYVKVAAA